MTAREEILARIAEAVRDVPESERPDDVEIPRAYARGEPDGVVQRFVDRVSEYKADVQLVRSEGVAIAIRERCRLRGVSRLGVPSDLPAAWQPKGVELVLAEALDARELDALDGALTGCALAIAETGTIVLDAGARQGNRALSLVPDYHLCVVEDQQVVGGVPEAMSQIATIIRRLLRPVTFVSGPSATSDIELSRVEGVHGPRTLDVLVIGSR